MPEVHHNDKSLTLNTISLVTNGNIENNIIDEHIYNMMTDDKVSVCFVYIKMFFNIHSSTTHITKHEQDEK